MNPHDLFETGDADAPASIKDANGEVVLALCRKCGQGEASLAPECPIVSLSYDPFTDEVEHTNPHPNCAACGGRGFGCRECGQTGLQMNGYALEVLNDSEGADTREPARFTIFTRQALDERLLQVVGLILDGGLSPDEFRYLLPTAKSYVKAEATEGGFRSQKWLDAAENMQEKDPCPTCRKAVFEHPAE